MIEGIQNIPLTRRNALKSIVTLGVAYGVAGLEVGSAASSADKRMKITRLAYGPIIHPSLDDTVGTNINGPSVIRVPDWVEKPLGRFYLYFAHHQGRFIRMAYSDCVTGPYTVYKPGVLSVDDSPFKHHIASPDVHVDNEARCIWMHYHGMTFRHPNTLPFSQASCYATSTNGLHFESQTTYLAESYIRSFKWRGWTYAFSGGSLRLLSRSPSPDLTFEHGPVLDVSGETFTKFESESRPATEGAVLRMRHAGLLRRGNLLHILYSNVGDCPERIKKTTVDISPDWTGWRGEAFEEVIRPETPAEGVNQRMVPSVEGACHEARHELRDPYPFEDDGQIYLFYSIAGEQGISVALVNGLD